MSQLNEHIPMFRQLMQELTTLSGDLIALVQVYCHHVLCSSHPRHFDTGDTGKCQRCGLRCPACLQRLYVCKWALCESHLEPCNGCKHPICHDCSEIKRCCVCERVQGKDTTFMM